jgi:hypothetical protein
MKIVRGDSSRNARKPSVTKRELHNGTRKLTPASKRKKLSTLNELRKLPLLQSELR